VGSTGRASLRPSSGYAPAWFAAVFAFVLLVGHDPSRLSEPFGPSHVGFNNALYMIGGRAITEDGPVKSRLGASSGTTAGDRVLYAHHPPLVYLEDAIARVVPVSDELRSRLPALVGSAGALALVVLLLRESGIAAWPAAIGVLVAFVTPMFLVFGATTEPHLIGLAPMAASALVWQRARRGTLRWRPIAIAAVAVVAGLTSWLALGFAAVAGVALVVEKRSGTGVALLAGAAVAAVAVFAWILWVYGGDLRDFTDRLVLRTGADDALRVTVREAAARQRSYLADLFPVLGAAALALAAAAIVDARTRNVAGAALASIVLYAAVFHNAAYDHSYWLYAVLLPLALGAAVAADALVRVAPPPAAAVAGIVVVAVLTVTALGTSTDRRLERRGAAIGTQVRRITWPASQRYAFHAFGGHGPTDLLPWLQYYSRREPFGVAGPQAVMRDDLVLTLVRSKFVAVPGTRDG
jgi:hypothetical protein